MKRRLMVLVLLACPLAAQEQKNPDERKPQVNKIFILKYADPRQLSQLLDIFGGGLIPSPDLHALAVTARPELMPAIEEAIQRLDVPSATQQNIELTVHYLIAGAGENTPGGAVPKELDPVVAQLKNSFAFKTYRLLDVLTLRTRTAQTAEASSTPGSLTPGLPSTVTQFRIQSARLSSDGSIVTLLGLKAGLRLPVAAAPPVSADKPFTYIDLGLNADVDIKEAQKVVVGRLSVNKDQALFLVLTARVL